MLIFEEESAETYCDKRVPGCNTPILNVEGLEPTLIPPHIKDKVKFLCIMNILLLYTVLDFYNNFNHFHCFSIC